MARKDQQRNGVFCAVRDDGYACSNVIRHATAKQQLHCTRGMMFSTRAVPRWYKQGSYWSGVSWWVSDNKVGVQSL
jgi:hypothetical protein